MTFVNQNYLFLTIFSLFIFNFLSYVILNVYYYYYLFYY